MSEGKYFEDLDVVEGDTVVCVHVCSNLFTLHKEYVVGRRSDGKAFIRDDEGSKCTFSYSYFVVKVDKGTKYPNPPHKHKDLIVAWLLGADIQYCDGESSWHDIEYPSWYEKEEYRIKPSEEITTKQEIKEIREQMEKLANKLKTLENE